MPDSQMKMSQNFENLIDHLARNIDPKVIHQMSRLSNEDFIDLLRRIKDQKDETRFECDKCTRTYSNRDSFRKHYKTHDGKTYNCDICNKSLKSRETMQKHKRRVHGISKRKFKESTEHANLQDSPLVKKMKTGLNEKNALNSNVKTYSFEPTTESERNDLIVFFSVKFDVIKSTLAGNFSNHKGFKWNLNTKVSLYKPKSETENVEAISHFRSKTYKYVSENDLQDSDLIECFHKMHESFSAFIQNGSGWRIKEIMDMEMKVSNYQAVASSSYIPAPTYLKNTKSLINVKNKDDKCFIWSVLASLYPAEQHANRVSKYRQYEGTLNVRGITFPFTLDQINSFEKQNEISVNIFGCEKSEVFPLFITKKPSTQAVKHVNLLLLKEGEKSHYICIRNLDRFLFHLKSKKTGRRPYFCCPYCLHGFTRKQLQEDHISQCQTHGLQKTSFPSEKNRYLTFTDFNKQKIIPFVIYADFETLNKPIHTCQPSGDRSSTTHYSKLEPCSYGIKRVCHVDDQYTKETYIYRSDENLVEHFLKRLLVEADEIADILKQQKPLRLSQEETRIYQNANRCYVCHKPFFLNNKKTRDHCHLTGKFLGAACNRCNLQLKVPNFIPVIFHNLRNFDSHIICQAIGTFKTEEITCIPNNMEKYISFSLGPLRFIDSYQFLNASLETLVQNLHNSESYGFRLLRNEGFSEEQCQLLTRKGVYFYDYVTSMHVFDEAILPEKKYFYNKLTEAHISDEDYAQAKKIWNAFQMKNLGEYHDVYLRSDVCLLACVFEHFRTICLEFYNLDPAHFFTAPGLSWSAMLKTTNIKLELITDPDQYLFIEKGIRGGICSIFKRYAKANNPLIPETFDPDFPLKYLISWDANSLYGWAQCQTLPYEGFQWLEQNEMQSLNVTDIEPTGDIGYILEVDLEYPDSIHSLLNDYPVGVEKRAACYSELSDYSKKMWKTHPTSEKKFAEKLVPTLVKKTHYVVHYRNLQLYLQLGVKLTKLHRVMRFKQKPWLKPYIDFNTINRAKAKSEFEKSFWKLMVNSCYGKFLENLRDRRQIRLIHNEEKLLRYIAKPSFESFKIFSPDLVAVECKKINLLLNRPIYLGFCILDLSKVLMYKFHYNFIKQRYGDKAELLFTDTDSLTYEIETHDIYEDMKNNLEYFDMSKYPREHKCFNLENKACVGYFKDETNGAPISEFVGLRPKLYSYTFSGEQKIRAKGIPHATNKLKFDLYKKCLFHQEPTFCTSNRILSKEHHLYCSCVTKVALSAFDDKRYILPDGIHTLAFGHYKIKDLHENA